MRNERQKFYSPTGLELYQEYSSHLLERIIPAYDRLFHGIGIKAFSIQEESLEAYALQKWDIPPWNIYTMLGKWRPHGPQKELGKIISPQGHVSYVADTGDLIIHNPEDTIYFDSVQKCWASCMDIQMPTERTIRLSYHMSGAVDEKNMLLETLESYAEELGRVKNFSVFYNGDLQQESPIYEHAIAYDMNPTGHVHCHQLFITGDTAREYFISEIQIGNQQSRFGLTLETERTIGRP